MLGLSGAATFGGWRGNVIDLCAWVAMWCHLTRVDMRERRWLVDCMSLPGLADLLGMCMHICMYVCMHVRL